MKEERFLVKKYGTRVLTLKGFKHLCLALKDNELVYNIMDWYKNVAKEINSTFSIVERNIRYFKSFVGEDDKKNQEFINNLIIEYNSTNK